MKNKSFLSIEKTQNKKKNLYYDNKKLLFLKIMTQKSSFDEEYNDVLKNQFSNPNLLQKANLNENLL